MKKEYFHNITKAYFAVKSISELMNETVSDSQHKWHTIIIVNSEASGEIAIDDYKIALNMAKVIFITPGQHIHFSDSLDLEGYALSFNKEFYCIEYHDSDVSCQGLLFVNNFSSVCFELNQQQLTIYNNTALEMISELENQESLQEEMLKNLLKNLLIRSNRLFREQMSIGEVDEINIDFVRKFSDLVEKHYKEHKQVEVYADMLGIASASLTKKLQKYGINSPSRIIKNRVITEAKRLLAYTDKSVKEIAAIIGFDDQFYFSRLFTKETGISPSEYKKNYIKA